MPAGIQNIYLTEYPEKIVLDIGETTSRRCIGVYDDYECEGLILSLSLDDAKLLVAKLKAHIRQWEVRKMVRETKEEAKE